MFQINKPKMNTHSFFSTSFFIFHTATLLFCFWLFFTHMCTKAMQTMSTKVKLFTKKENMKQTIVPHFSSRKTTTKFAFLSFFLSIHTSVGACLVCKHTFRKIKYSKVAVEIVQGDETQVPRLSNILRNTFFLFLVSEHISTKLNKHFKQHFNRK